METLGKAKPISRSELKLNELMQAEEALMQAEEARIARSNKRFEAADPAKKRVIIAKDVLQWLKAGKVQASPRTYLTYPGYTPVDATRVDGGSCQACALGAVFACAVERQGGLRNFWKLDDDDMREHLGSFFSYQQLQDIEAAFELFWKSHRPAPANFGHTVNREFGYDADEVHDEGAAKARMVAIMENIIANNGTFVP